MAYVESSHDDTDLDDEFEDELEDEQPEEPLTIEDRARTMGWKPLPADPNNPLPHEYRGDPRRWSTAEDFIRHGEEELPILRDQNRRLTERVARMEQQQVRTAEEQRTAIQAAIALAKRADERGYARAKAELLAKRDDAVDTGDRPLFDQVQAELDALENARDAAGEPPEPAPAPAPAGGPAAPAPEVAAFVAAHPWFADKTRPYLSQAMVAAHQAVMRESPNMALADQLQIALERMAPGFPELAQEDPMATARPATPRRRAPGALTPNPPVQQRRQAASPIDTIADPQERSEARAAFNSMRRMDSDFTEAEYMAIYDDPHVDVVELRRQRKK